MTVTVGMVGLGRLGLPIAVSYALHGFDVLAYDIDPARMSLAALSEHERGPEGHGRLTDSLNGSLPLSFTSLEEIGHRADCVFIAVPTPHGPLYEGITPLPESRADFGYDALLTALQSVMARTAPGTEVGVMSTVLPGTMRSLLLPAAAGRTVVYCPQFVSMGMVARDLYQPEFTLIGQDNSEPGLIADVLSSFGTAPVFVVSPETAELAKLMYNTYISAKVTLSNVTQMLSEQTGADALGVFRVLCAADRRVASAAYIGLGLGDGGSCHPRDNIAMSWLARKSGLRMDLFGRVMETRQAYTEWLADHFIELAGDLPLLLLGTAFKPGIDLETGSSAVLLANLLKAREAAVTIIPDPGSLGSSAMPASAAAFFIGCPEPEFTGYVFPPGSVVIDPWHEVADRSGVTVHRIGADPRQRAWAAHGQDDRNPRTSTGA
jgi:UDPglucose 6-dehydrogenase